MYSGLPDSIFSDQISHYGQISEGLAMEDVGIFYGHLVYFRAICNIVRLFGIVFPVLPEKSWQPCVTNGINLKKTFSALSFHEVQCAFTVVCVHMYMPLRKTGAEGKTSACACSDATD
jgi:hypothetical protein